MNKKGTIFMPLATIGFLIIMSVFIFLIFTHENQAKESFEIGKTQSNIIQNYFELEKTLFYHEKLLEYNEYKAIKEFAKNGAIPKTCNQKWKFNNNCEPNFKENFKEILSQELDRNYKEININSNIEIYFKDFNLPSESNTAEVEFKGKIIVKKQPLINFQRLETLKSCIKNNINNCDPESNIGTIYKFKKEIAEILNENLEKEKIFLEFEIDTKNSGLGIFS